MTEQEIVINIRLQPSAKNEEICGFMDDGTLKIRVKNKPIEGKANEGLILFLSKIFDIPKRNVEIIGGEKNRNKRIRIQGLSRTEMQKKLEELGIQEP
jgi:uncharacterized protein (TIGR00251 family)